MAGLIEEASSMIDQTAETSVSNAAFIGSAQKAEQDEIGEHTSFVSNGQKLGYTEALSLPAATLKEKQATN
jgi:ferritin-like metal-binding protein YciE